MNFNIFKAKQKTPKDLVKELKDAIKNVRDKKSKETVTKCLTSMRTILFGEEGSDPKPDLVKQLVWCVCSDHSKDNLNLLQLFADKNNLKEFEFEARKDVATIFQGLLRHATTTHNPEQSSATVEYLAHHPKILESLIAGYQDPDVALNYGQIIRECVRYEPLAKIVLYSSEFDSFFKLVDAPTFDIATDSFATFKEILTKHKKMVSEYLVSHYDGRPSDLARYPEGSPEAFHAKPFFDKYRELLLSENFVTKRQSLKLLGEILLDRSNFDVMTRYISDVNNLKLIMNLLRDKSRNIQFEAFHVFKIFVANPNKNKPIRDILIKNQEKLIQFLSSFHNDRNDDEQFNDEKAFLISQIQDL